MKKKHKNIIKILQNVSHMNILDKPRTEQKKMYKNNKKNTSFSEPGTILYPLRQLSRRIKYLLREICIPMRLTRMAYSHPSILLSLRAIPIPQNQIFFLFFQ